MLLKDIREARQAKSREGLSKLDHSELSVRTLECVLAFSLGNTNLFLQLPNLCSMEINEIRPHFVAGMNTLVRLVRHPEARPMEY